jgi:hypothetical protein
MISARRSSSSPPPASPSTAGSATKVREHGSVAWATLPAPGRIRPTTRPKPKRTRVARHTPRPRTIRSQNQPGPMTISRSRSERTFQPSAEGPGAGLDGDREVDAPGGAGLEGGQVALHGGAAGAGVRGRAVPAAGVFGAEFGSGGQVAAQRELPGCRRAFVGDRDGVGERRAVLGGGRGGDPRGQARVRG